ncbi:MAG: Maf family nucleotide pyrophosphatase [Bacteroidota bacterium]
MISLQNKKLILGSKSPRRKELLSQISPNIEIRIQEVDEIYDEKLDVFKVPTYLAELKATALTPNIQENEIIITADTIVILENEILGKPDSMEDAKKMLQKLSGKKHLVITGCCLSDMNKQKTFSVQTEVYFNVLTQEMIDFYVDTYKPLDKAGSYGIQEWIGMVGIEKINGSYYNVMGLPVAELWKELNEF